MDTLYFRTTGVATTLDVGLSMDNPWIIHGYIVFPNYWGGYYIGCWIIDG